MALKARIAKRITPAWAGKSLGLAWRSPVWQDHPRVGGEKIHMLLCVPSAYGSPPRGRGKVDHLLLFGQVLGITPAWAGKSYRFPVGLPPTWDHPRIGGEKGLGSQVTQLSQGSPPHGRGKARFSGISLPGVGITPAWAGKRPAWRRSRWPWRDHPRVGGEKGHT